MRPVDVASELLQAAVTDGWVVEQTATMRRGLLLRTTKHRLVHDASEQVLILEHRASGDLHRHQTYVRRGGKEIYWLDNAASVRSVIETQTVPDDAQPAIQAPA